MSRILITTAAEIRTDFSYALICRANDRNYADPTQEWLSSVFYPYYANRLITDNIHRYASNNDCNRFSLYLHADINRCHAQAPGKHVPQGVSCGEFEYTTESGIRHMINVVKIDGIWLYIEPQIRVNDVGVVLEYPRTLDLTEKERMEDVCVFF